MNEFVTVDKSSPVFQDYLLGGSSQEVLPLPVQSLNVNQTSERVTFEIVPVGQIVSPGYFYILFRLFRFELLLLTVLPMYASTLFLKGHANYLSDLLMPSWIALMFLHAAVFCRNDYVDHMRGTDRINEKSGSQVIQRGWLKARTVRNLFFANLIVAAILAIPIFKELPEVVAVGAIASGLGVLGYSHLRWGTRVWIFGDLCVFMCLGPMLTLTASWIAIRQLDEKIFLLGCFYGLLAVTYVYARQLTSIVVDDSSGRTTMPVALGFDRAKKLLTCVLVFAGLLALPIYSFFTSVLVAASAFWIAYRVYKIHSPLSSEIYTIPRYILILYFVTGLEVASLILVAPLLVALLYYLLEKFSWKTSLSKS